MKTSDLYKIFIIRICFNPLPPRLILLFSSLCFQSPLIAQDKTQYLLHEIPQTLALNPAIIYKCKSYIELPLISQLQFYYRNSGFSHKQAFIERQGFTEDTTRIDIDRLARVIGNRNHIRLGGKAGLLGFGFEANDWFFSMNISNRTSGRLSFNRDIIDARDGNWDLTNNLPREVIINGTGIHLINYTEFAIGAAYQINPKFSAGIRAKYLLGSAHIQTRRSNIGIITTDSPLELTVTSDLLVRGNLPLDLALDNEGYVTDAESHLNSYSDLPALLLSWNHGMAVDAGIIYSYSEKVTFSASLLDIGFIQWRKNTSMISQDEEFVFQGIDMNNYLQSNAETDFIQALQDSIETRLRLSGSNDPYTAMIPARFFIATDYKWNQKINLGVVLEGEILSSRLYPSITFTAIYRPSDILSASLSYSLMDRGFANLGYGIIIGKSPVSFYFVSDNIPFTYVHEEDQGLIWPYSARTMNFRIGMNIILGCRDKQAYFKKTKWRKSCPAYQ